MTVFGDKVIYVLDTNTFRYETNPGAQAVHKAATNQFWLKVKDELLNQKVNLYTPNEVLRELEVQFFGLRDTEKEDIGELLKTQIVIPDNVYNIELEHHIRVMSAYVRSKYNIVIGTDFEMLPKKVNYPAQKTSCCIQQRRYPGNEQHQGLYFISFIIRSKRTKAI